MRTVRLILIIIPWVIILSIVLFDRKSEEPKDDIKQTTVVLNEIESIGKLELVKYNFKEITELKELSKRYFRIFQLGPDSKIALISEGQAVGCIDLKKITEDDIRENQDTLYIRLPEPEICYYKLDLSKTRIYSLETNPLKDEKEFIKRAYDEAEDDIRKAAISGGILPQTTENAKLVLKPLLQKITSKQIVFTSAPNNSRIEDM